jgi:hypothetical protein
VVCDDTVLRQLKKRAQGTAVPPTIIGIDDWSWRKSQTYGTIIVNLERRVVIDVLEDRDVVTCADWLKRHPKVEVISRDRCDLYAQAAWHGAPRAEQVADRFHILQNLRPAIEEQINLHDRATGKALLSDADNITAAGNLLKSRLAHRTSWKEIFTTIHALRNQGLSCSEIGRRASLSSPGAPPMITPGRRLTRSPTSAPSGSPSRCSNVMTLPTSLCDCTVWPAQDRSRASVAAQFFTAHKLALTPDRDMTIPQVLLWIAWRSGWALVVALKHGADATRIF